MYRIITFYILSTVCVVLWAQNFSYVDSLSEKSYFEQLNLLNRSLLYNGPLIDKNVDIKGLYQQQKYADYIYKFEKNSFEQASNKLRYFYVVALFKEQRFNDLDAVVDKVSSEDISILEYNNLQIIRAHCYYLHFDEQALRTQYIALEKQGIVTSENLSAIKYYQEILAAKQNKSSSKTLSGVYVNYIMAVNNLKEGKLRDSYSKFGLAGLDERNDLVFLNKGLLLMSSANYEESSQLFATINEQSTLGKEYGFRLIESLFFKGDFVAVLDKISWLRLSFKDLDIYKERLKTYEALSYYYLANYPKAKELLLEVNDLTLAKIFIADLYFKEGQPQKASELYEKTLNNKALNRKEKFFATYGYAWTQFNLAQFAKSRQLFSSLLEMGYEEPQLITDITLKIADCNFNLNNYKDALASYQNVLKKVEANKENKNNLYKNILFNLAKIYSKTRKYQESNETLATLIDYSDNKEDQYLAKIKMSDNYILMAENAVAIQLLQDVIKSYDYREEDVYIKLADTYYNINSYEDAYKTYSLYLKIFTSGERTMDGYYGVVQSLYKLKKYDQALAEAKKVDQKFMTQIEKEFQQKIKFDKEHGNE